MPVIPALVSDTGPLISFEKIPSGFDLLTRIVTQVYVPPAVQIELDVGVKPTFNFIQFHKLSNFVRVVSVSEPCTDLFQLDEGERQAIHLARTLQLYVMIDELAGRSAAAQIGVEVVGSAGLLAYGLKHDLIESNAYRLAIDSLFRAGRLGRELYGSFIQLAD